MFSNTTFSLKMTYFTVASVGRDYHVGDHAHVMHQWFYVYEGGIRLVIDDSEYILSRNDCILIPPHAVRSPSWHRKNPTYLCTVFDIGDIDLSPLELKVMPLVASSQAALDGLREGAWHPGFEYSDMLRDTYLLQAILGQLRATHMSGDVHAAAGGGNSPERIAGLVSSFIRSNLHRPLVRKDLAEAVNLSVAQTSRLYKKATGKSLNAALTEFRLERAKVLLESSTLPITHIALAVGFNSFSHFTQTFHKITGYSPSEYRRTHGFC